MDLKAFLAAIPAVGTSVYALIGYALVVLVWGLSTWQSKRLQVIAARLRDLPEKDRLKALELEYRIVPKSGLDANAYLRLKATQYKFAAVVVLLAVIVLLASLATYKAVEDRRLATTVQSMAAALKVTRMGKSAVASNSPSIAAGNLEAALKIHPTVEGYLNLGYIYEELSNIDGAVLAYRRALSVEPDNLVARNNLGMVLKDSKKYIEALEHLAFVQSKTKPGEELWVLSMVNSGVAHFELGRSTNDVKTRAAQCQIAIEQYFIPALEFKGALRDRDLAAKALANLGNCYKDVDEYDKARIALDEAVAIKRRLAASRSLGDTLVNVADLKLKQGRFADARPDLIEAIAHFSALDYQIGLGSAHYNLGDIAWAEGRKADAKGHYTKSVEHFRFANATNYVEASQRRLQRLERNEEPEFVRRARGAA